MTKVVRRYKHVRQPSDDASLRQWLETELTAIKNTLDDIVAALVAANLAK